MRPFVHDDPDFDDVLRIVATERGIGVALIEKDYWVTHTLWALHKQGFELWFKGGTSLSKGFGLIKRFSEDLDLKIEPGAVTTLSAVANWKSESSKSTSERGAHFEQLAGLIQVAGASVSLGDAEDPSHRSANIHITYPGRHHSSLPAVLRPFVLLEVGNARVTPFVERDLTSFVHERLAQTGQLGDFEDNRPRSVRCVHPLVTLLEKLDALARRVPREGTEPAVFVRHFEDAAHIIRAARNLPSLRGYATIRALADELHAHKQLKVIPSATDPVFSPGDSERWSDVRRAHKDIRPMFWGPRISIEEACADIRGWLEVEFGEPPLPRH
ncbi:MAG: nucleotidyl transferase AbiEii/AbiGii toxin family protein [Deltaproteobacteria bacterium]|nr:nucleotidyl transferase AbiEii/AbiGii toxin family protein [Deltaproteobacteria bacterium]